jgi:hypothetical protein
MTKSQKAAKAILESVANPVQSLVCGPVSETMELIAAAATISPATPILGTETTTPDAFAEYAETLTMMDPSKHARECNKLRNSFIELLGLPAAGSPVGYKAGKVADLVILEETIRIKNMFSVLVKTTGKYRPILEKMERNLRNSDRASLFASLERKAAKQADVETIAA